MTNNSPDTNDNLESSNDTDLQEIKALDVEGRFQVYDEEGSKSLAEIKEDNKNFLAVTKNKFAIVLGVLILGFLFWTGVNYEQDNERTVELIIQDTELTTSEKVEMLDKLNNNVFDKNSGMFLGTLGLIIGYLIGHSNNN